MKVSYSWSNQPSGMKSKVPSDEYYHYGDNVMVDTTYNNKSGYKEEVFNANKGTMPNYKWNSVCYGNGKFVTISSGTIADGSNVFAYSTDGITWTQGTLPISVYWKSVCYGDGKFVAVAMNTNVFAYSANGITWTQGTMPSRSWESVCYGNGKYIAYNSNKFAYSANGITWTEGTLPINLNGGNNNICYGAGKFVAITYDSSEYAYSTDGINWTKGTLSSNYSKWCTICYGNGKFVVISNSCSFAIISSDGINWVEINTNENVQANYVYYGGGVFIIVPRGAFSQILYSKDGINWTQRTLPSSYNSYCKGCYGNDRFVILNTYNYTDTFHYFTISDSYYQFSGWNKSNFNITADTAVSGSWSQVSSGGGVNFSELTPWKEKTTTGLNAQIHDICCGNNIWLATGYQYVYYSTNDGLNWSKVQPGNTSDNWYYTCYGNGKFIITTTNGYMKYSIDAINWSNCTSNYSLTSSTASNWGTITYGNNMFVAAGNNTLGAYSLDGITWEKLSGSYHPSSYVTWCNDKFLAKASIDPGASYSLDGITWNKINGVKSTNPPCLFAYGNGIYIGIYRTKSNSYPNYYSTDGINWTKNEDISSTASVYNHKVIHFGKYFILCSGYGNAGKTNIVHMSTDGINWNEYILGPESLQWYSIAVNEDSGKVIMVSLGTGSSDNAIIATCNGIPDLDYIR